MKMMLRTATLGLVLSCGMASARSEVVIELVPVGHPGNPGNWSGQSVQILGNITGAGFDRLCGGVNYPFQIAKYEITVNQYVEFLNAVAAADPYNLYLTSMTGTSLYAPNITRNGTSGSYTYTVGDGSPQAVSHWGNRPINFIAWADAARFCNWMQNGQPTGLLTGVGADDAWLTEDGTYATLGAPTIGPNVNQPYQPIVRRPGATWVIPTEDEWYKAAYHKNDGPTPNYSTYPTNYSGSPWFGTPNNNVIDPDPGNNANYHIGNPDDDCIGGPFSRTQVGEFENSPSSYGTYDQGGNVWEWTETRYLNVNGELTFRRVMRGGSFYPSVVQQQPDGYKCMHAAWRQDEPPVSQVGRYGFRLAKVINDCNNNGLMDQEELAAGTAHDRNYNGVLDSCDIALGTSQDCNGNGIVDEAEVGDVSPPPYRVDDGTPADLLSAIGYLGDEESGYMAWLNQFTIAAGRETIGGIIPQFLPQYVPDGTAFTVHVWSDPNGDRNPNDAVLLASAAAVMAPGLTVVPIPDTYIGPEGTHFFVGIVMHILDWNTTYPASYDDSSDMRASWIAWSANAIDANNLPAAENLSSMTTLFGGGNFMLRALPAVGVMQVPDDNNNGIPDACEALPCPTTAGDLDGNGAVNGIDIQGFVACHLLGPGITSGCVCADMNAQPDAALNSLDIPLFVNKLLGP